MSLSNDHAYESLFSDSIKVVERILDTTKNPQLAGNVDHEYNDKYSLVELMTNTTIASILNVFEHLDGDGFGDNALKQMIDIVQKQNKSVTLNFTCETTCRFLTEKTVEIEAGASLQVKKETVETDNEGKETKTTAVATHKILNQVKEYHWEVSVSHSLTLFSGTDKANGINLGNRTAATALVTRTKKEPVNYRAESEDTNLTRLFRWVEPTTMKCCFSVDRDNASTPRRNEQVEEVFTFVYELRDFWAKCDIILRQCDLSAKPTTNKRFSDDINADNIFIPILPVFLQGKDAKGDDECAMTDKDDNKPINSTAMQAPANDDALVSLDASNITDDQSPPLLPFQDISSFLVEHCRSLKARIEELKNKLPASTEKKEILSHAEAKLNLLCCHLTRLLRAYIDGVEYVEHMLYKQLVQAIGKEVEPEDFNAFLRFHNKRLFAKSYSPKPFCYAIRQPNQYPDGSLSIIAKERNTPNNNNNNNPIETFARHIPGDSTSTPIYVPLNAATTVEFVGDQYIHGWVDTFFTSKHQPDRENYYINARARQFSCFVLVSGTISGPNEFTPKDAIILQNKDEILIPLLLTALPSAKEFQDATKSLSPEQARFAKSFRSMQLGSSLFGICVVQVKPQLECLLNLPPNSLMKEIQLMQDILTLFVDYQIPSSLVSYDGSETASSVDKVSAVKSHVEKVMTVVEGIKEKQLKDEIKKADMRAEMQFQHPQPGVARSCSGSVTSFEMQENVQGFNDKDGDEFEMLKEGKDKKEAGTSEIQFDNDDGIVDLTSMPKKLDRIFETFDSENALRTVLLSTGERWELKRQQNLLSKLEISQPSNEDKKTEYNKAIDLLDALSRSGSLPIASGELHVIIGVRHSFEQNVMATVIEKNMNPIEKVDYSSLLVASSIHNVSIPTMISGSAEPPTLVLAEKKFPPMMIGSREN